MMVVVGLEEEEEKKEEVGFTVTLDCGEGGTWVAHYIVK